jgi:hypothetical protein
VLSIVAHINDHSRAVNNSGTHKAFYIIAMTGDLLLNLSAHRLFEAINGGT